MLLVMFWDGRGRLWGRAREGGDVKIEGGITVRIFLARLDGSGLGALAALELTGIELERRVDFGFTRRRAAFARPRGDRDIHRVGQIFHVVGRHHHSRLVKLGLGMEDLFEPAAQVLHQQFNDAQRAAPLQLVVATREFLDHVGPAPDVFVVVHSPANRAMTGEQIQGQIEQARAPKRQHGVESLGQDRFELFLR